MNIHNKCRTNLTDSKDTQVFRGWEIHICPERSNTSDGNIPELLKKGI